MRAPSPLGGRSGRLALAAALALGAAVRLPTLAAPLLEGAAGKQAHLAMVARNLYRGRATWTRPVVDDIGRPGYFVKELPAFPVAVAAAYRTLAGVREWAGRALAAAGWLAATPLVAALAARIGGGPAPPAAGLFFVLSPLGLVYSRGFLNDPWAVASSILALWLGLRWREAPSLARAACCGLAAGLALLLKPHVAFWLGPSLAVLALAAGPIRGRDRASLLACGAAGAALAAPWYAHAWAVHRDYPAAGAMVASGWIEPRLWLEPRLYGTVLGHALWMVLTPAGAVAAALGAIARPRPSRREPLEIALLAWGGGVLIQCVALGTRMLDRPARGSEYYELALVPAAAIWVGLGLERLRGVLARRPRARRAIPGALVAAMALSGVPSTLEALRPPPRYRGLLAGCAAVRHATRPEDEIAVLADRPGTVLYYCDRRGLTLVPASPDGVLSPPVASLGAGFAWRAGRALDRARYFYVPFPELLKHTPQLAAALERAWRRSGRVPPDVLLYERRRSAPAADASPAAAPSPPREPRRRDSPGGAQIRSWITEASSRWKWAASISPRSPLVKSWSPARRTSTPPMSSGWRPRISP